MENYIAIGPADMLKKGQKKCIEVEGQKVAIFNIDGTFYAIEDSCTHQGGPLSEGELDNATIACPWHGATFDVTSGKALSLPAEDHLRTYSMRITEDNLEISLVD